MSKEKINNLKLMGSKVFICPTHLDHDHPESYTGLAEKLSKNNDTWYPN